jgi:hypothetical protein
MFQHDPPPEIQDGRSEFVVLQDGDAIGYPSTLEDAEKLIREDKDRVRREARGGTVFDPVEWTYEVFQVSYRAVPISAKLSSFAFTEKQEAQMYRAADRKWRNR